MRLLIAVKSCERDMIDGCHYAIRQTWGKDIAAGRADLRFFVGNSLLATPYDHTGDLEFKDLALMEDEVHLREIPDSYADLPWKTQAICNYAMVWAYDFVFFCDTDTCVDVNRLLTCGFENADYTGLFIEGTGCKYPYCSGGVGYFLSQRAVQQVTSVTPTHWAEDLFVGQALGPAIFDDKKLSGFHPLRYDRYVARHLGLNSWERRITVPDWMRNCYQASLEYGGLAFETVPGMHGPAPDEPAQLPRVPVEKPSVLEALAERVRAIPDLSEPQIASAIALVTGYYNSYRREPCEAGFNNLVKRARQNR
jgi:hypothetical protein